VLDSDRSMNITFNQKDKKGVCSGDSGGAIFVESQGELKILAVTSIVISNTDKASESKDICHGSNRAMYIPAYSQWIKDNMATLK
jgi:secreted trypsin-like serine protease